MKVPILHPPLRFPVASLRVYAHPLILLICLTACGLTAQESGSGALPSSGLDLETLREFEGLDRDRDRVLSTREFSRGELALRARDLGGVAEGAVFRAIDLDGSGTIELGELLRSQLHRNLRFIDRAGSRPYMELDRDHDGLISEEEYLQREQADPAVFRRIDLNGSGKVGPVEWLHALAREPERKEIMRRFAVLDKDDSGSLDPSEFDGEAGEFDLLDANGNGVLSPGELARTASRERAGELDDTERELFQSLDRNGDQVLSLREFGSHERFQGGRFEEAMKRRLFAHLDANGDGELDSREFAKRREAARGGGAVGKGRPARGKDGGGPGGGKGTK